MSFGLDFADKAAVLGALSHPCRSVVRARPDRSVRFDQARTVLVEGDNLAMLQRLRTAYFERVQTIYIDPPYNTGHDFVYRDRYGESVQEHLRRTGQVDAQGSPLRVNPNADGRYHSAWLAMMYARLWHARALLHPEGLLFVSIDDHEVHHLRVLLDEIFGEDCFIAQIVVVTNRGGRDYLRIATGHEYLLVYGATPTARVRELPKPPPADQLCDDRGPYVLRELRNRNPKFHPGNRPNLFYPLFVDPSRDDGNGGLAVSLEPRAGYALSVEPRNRLGEGSVWRWGRPKAAANIVDDDPVASTVVAKRRRDGGYNICEKHRKSTVKAKGLWDEAAMRTEQGTLDLRAVLGRPVFDHPKPVALIERCLRLGTDPHGVVLDFFAGSGTTAEAVARLDAEDGGSRTCLLGQWPQALNTPEFESITDITRARVEAVLGPQEGLRTFALEDRPELGAVDSVSQLRDQERARERGFDLFDAALELGLGLHARRERRGAWTILRDGERVLAHADASGSLASLQALDLPAGTSVIVPDSAWSEADRLRAAARFAVRSEAG